MNLSDIRLGRTYSVLPSLSTWHARRTLILVNKNLTTRHQLPSSNAHPVRSSPVRLSAVSSPANPPADELTQDEPNLQVRVSSSLLCLLLGHPFYFLSLWFTVPPVLSKETKTKNNPLLFLTKSKHYHLVYTKMNLDNMDN